MAITTVSDLSNSAVTNYKKTALDFAWGQEVWGQFVEWQDPIADDGGNGKTLDVLAFGEMDPAITALSETTDITPENISDYNVTVTPYEYGNAAGITQLAKFESRAPLQTRLGRIVGKNRTRSVDRLIRNGVIGGTQVMYAGTATTRLTLDATSDLPTFDWLMDMVSTAENAGMEPMDSSGNYVSIVNPQLIRELTKLAQWTNPRYYRGSDIGGDLYRGEVGMLAGIRFVKNRFGKVYLSGGTLAQAATTISAAVSAGGTAVSFTSDTGIAIGDYLTIGTLEGETAEQVQVTAGASSPYTIRGVGQGPSSFGFRFDHAALETASEGANVAAVPLIGMGSILGVFAKRTGKYGEFGIAGGMDILKRFIYPYWYWYGGIGIVQRYIIRGECAITGGVVGYN